MFSKYKELINSYHSPNLFIFLHNNADPDAVCAALAVGELSSKINENVNFSIFSDSINTSARRIVESENIVVNEDFKKLNINDENIIITVDTANLSQLGKFESWVIDSKLPIIAFDHHNTFQISEFVKLGIFVQEASSTCFIIAKAFFELGLEPSPKIATLLISGHVYDSRRFLHSSTAELFNLMAKLIELGGNYDQANLYLQNEMSLGERIARIKANKRITYSILDKKYLIATSYISAFEASAARSLIGLGCDVVLVLAPKENELRGSARIRLDLNISMGKIIELIAKEFNGTGGGHEQAAGLNINPPPPKADMKKIMKRFTELVESEYYSNSSLAKKTQIVEENDV